MVAHVSGTSGGGVTAETNPAVPLSVRTYTLKADGPSVASPEEWCWLCDRRLSTDSGSHLCMYEE
jgi:hypothetical protein